VKKVLVPLVILLVCAFVITGCSSNATSTATTAAANTQPVTTTAAVTTTTAIPVTTVSKAGGTLRVMTNGLPAMGFVPQAAFGGVDVLKWALETPLTQDRQVRLHMKMVDDVQFTTPDGKPGQTFKLKKGIKFQDGTVWDANAVKWNLDLLYSEKLFLGVQDWTEVKVIDDYTVAIYYKVYDATHFTDLDESMGFMISPTAYQKNGKDWAKWNMVGTGPFIQKDFKQDTSASFTKNTNYWQTGLPYLDGVDVSLVVDAFTQEANMKAGNVDVFYGADVAQASRLKDAGFKIYSMPGGAYSLTPDSANAGSPWSNLKVRQAAEYALDKEGLAKALGYGYWLPAYQLVATDVNGVYDPNFVGRRYDLAKAKSLLSEAGYPNGFKTKIIASTAHNHDMISGIQAALAKAGIDATIDYQEPTKYTATYQGTWDNALIYSNPNGAGPNMNNGFVQSYGEPAVQFKSLARPAGFNDRLTTSRRAPVADPWVPMGDVKLLKGLVQEIYDNCMVIPVTYTATLAVTNNKVNDLGIFEFSRSWPCTPEKAWLTK
jgi:peptide/nickel transport system substrate-binding protein